MAIDSSSELALLRTECIDMIIRRVSYDQEVDAQKVIAGAKALVDWIVSDDPNDTNAPKLRVVE